MVQMELPMPISGLPLDLRALALEIHAANIAAGWWKQEGVPVWCKEVGYHVNKNVTQPRNVGELQAQVHSEISEADEGFIGELMDDKLPHRPMVEVERADVAIRVLDMLSFYDHACVCDPPRTLPLPEFAYWPDWCLLMHRVTTQALEHFRKGREGNGCDALVDLLGVVHFAAIQFGYDLSGAIAEKRAFNATRADHQLENRAKAGGKAF